MGIDFILSIYIGLLLRQRLRVEDGEVMIFSNVNEVRETKRKKPKGFIDTLQEREKEII